MKDWFFGYFSNIWVCVSLPFNPTSTRLQVHFFSELSPLRLCSTNKHRVNINDVIKSDALMVSIWKHDTKRNIKLAVANMNEWMNVKFIILSHTTFINDNTDFRQICPMCAFFVMYIVENILLNGYFKFLNFKPMRFMSQ